MKIFLCVPMTSRCDSAGCVILEYRSQMERLIEGLRNSGHEAYCSLEYAGWKMGGYTSPEDELAHDFEQVGESDLVVSLLEEKISAGCQLENGYAYALGKRVQLYQLGKPAWTNLAFGELSGYDLAIVESDEDFVNKVLEISKSL